MTLESPRGSRIPKESDSADPDPLKRFSDRVDDYVRYRPGYPPEVIEFLRLRMGLGEASVVADIGSGTGIFTRMLLETGARVVAVEPNDAMRSAAEAELSACRNFTSVKGSAEATGLPANFASLITCAQAFHWFEPSGTRREFIRIAGGSRGCAVIWNTAVADRTEFGQGYERIKEEFGTDFQRIRHENIEKNDRFNAFFGVGNWARQSFGNSQTLDFMGLKGRLLSSSYAPKEGHPRHEQMIGALTRLFHQCQRDGVVRMDYTTEVFFGKLGLG